MTRDVRYVASIYSDAQLNVILLFAALRELRKLEKTPLDYVHFSRQLVQHWPLKEHLRALFSYTGCYNAD